MCLGRANVELTTREHDWAAVSSHCIDSFFTM
jgi:hypothetical protein